MNYTILHTSITRFFWLSTCLLLLISCENNTQVVEKKQHVIVYTDNVGTEDSLLFASFEKQHQVKVYVHKFTPDSLLKTVQSERYNSYADLIILHGINQLYEAENLHFFRPFTFEKIDHPSYQEKYQSSSKKWIALAKSPLVIAYDKRVLKGDTLKNFTDLLLPTWKGKISLQQENTSTLQTLNHSLHAMQYTEATTFISALKKSAIQVKGGDEAQLKKLNEGKGQLAIVELAALLRLQSTQKDSLGNSRFQHLAPIFPNQTKKGTFYAITGAGIYRYARNVKHAEQLLTFLMQQGQQNFAKGRFEFPVKSNVALDPALLPYEKFRARFIQ